MRVRRRAMVAAGMLVLLGCTGGAPSEEPQVSTATAIGTPAPAGTPATPLPEDPAALLTVADRKDGDSFVASDGVEYRVGLINTPELADCGGAAASDVTYALLDDGFTAEAYASDVRGRTVARLMTSEGDLGVLLAERGWADDRYLEDFRSENPAYAAELDTAFAVARRDQVGLYRTCWAADAQRASAPSGGPVTHVGADRGFACHPAYLECLPEGPDLDCAEVGHQVQLLGDADPFRLDGNSLTATDGVGCDTFEPWRADGRYPYLGGSPP